MKLQDGQPARRDGLGDIPFTRVDEDAHARDVRRQRTVNGRSIRQRDVPRAVLVEHQADGIRARVRRKNRIFHAGDPTNLDRYTHSLQSFPSSFPVGNAVNAPRLLLT